MSPVSGPRHSNQHFLAQVLRYGRTLGFTEVTLRLRETDGGGAAPGRVVATGRHTKMFGPERKGGA
jgi:hypothetical protein